MDSTIELRKKIDFFIAAIHQYAIEDLGCGCPEHVFEQIRVLRGEASPGKAELALVIGEQLLVLFGNYGALEPFEYEMPRLILSGITYRDSIGLNRFRLVLGDNVSEEHRGLITEEIKKYDDKVHVHYMS